MLTLKRACLITSARYCRCFFPSRTRHSPSLPVRRLLRTSSVQSPLVCDPCFPIKAEELALFQLLMDVIDHFHLLATVRVAGGWLRNKLLRVGDGDDLDFALEHMTGEEFAQSIRKYATEKCLQTPMSANVHVIPPNPEKSKHLATAKLNVTLLGRVFYIDFAQMRSETYTQQHRIPQVKIGTPHEDAFRRDFTMNALFYNIHTKKVEDYTRMGFDDLKARVLRTPLSAHQTFNDDPLRVLRAVRFASAYHLNLHPDIVTAARTPAVKAGLVHKVTPPRIGHEIKKMLQCLAPCARSPHSCSAKDSFVLPFLLLRHLHLDHLLRWTRHSPTTFSEPVDRSSCYDVDEWSTALKRLGFLQTCMNSDVAPPFSTFPFVRSIFQHNPRIHFSTIFAHFFGVATPCSSLSPSLSKRTGIARFLVDHLSYDASIGFQSAVLTGPHTQILDRFFSPSSFPSHLFCSSIDSMYSSLFAHFSSILLHSSSNDAFLFSWISFFLDSKYRYSLRKLPSLHSASVGPFSANNEIANLWVFCVILSAARAFSKSDTRLFTLDIDTASVDVHAMCSQFLSQFERSSFLASLYRHASLAFIDAVVQSPVFQVLSSPPLLDGLEIENSVRCPRQHIARIQNDILWWRIHRRREIGSKLPDIHEKDAIVQFILQQYRSKFQQP